MATPVVSGKIGKTLLRELNEYFRLFISSGEGENWKKIFYRGLMNKLLVKILSLIAGTYQTSMLGKGIEGCITYKTWARPPCIIQRVIIISRFIDMLSRPGNHQTDVSYA